jgi:hypothetical protein
MSEQRKATAMQLLPGEARAAAGRPIHAFDSSAKANAWLAENEPHRVIAPHKYGGWGPFIGEVREGLHDVVRGEHVVVELAPDANEATKVSVRSLGRALLERGALTVHCHGRRIYPDGVTPPDPRQSNLFGGR